MHVSGPRRSAMGWLLAAGLPLLAGSSLLAEEPTVRLRYAFKPGERLTMDVEHRAVTDTTISGARQSVETSTDSRKIWTILSVEEDGRTTLENSVDRVSMTSRSSDRGELRWKSGDGTPPPPGYEGVAESLGVPLSRTVIDPFGRILKRQDLRPTTVNASNTGDFPVVPLPDHPVKVGDEWTVPQEVVVDVPNGPRRAVKTRLRYRLAAVEGGLAKIDVDTTVLTPIDDPRLEAHLLERIWDGRILFDIARGRVERRTTGTDRNVVGFSGPQSSIHYKAKLDERLVGGKQPD